MSSEGCSHAPRASARCPWCRSGCHCPVFVYRLSWNTRSWPSAFCMCSPMQATCAVPRRTASGDASANGRRAWGFGSLCLAPLKAIELHLSVYWYVCVCVCGAGDRHGPRGRFIVHRFGGCAVMAVRPWEDNTMISRHMLELGNYNCMMYLDSMLTRGGERHYGPAYM